MLVWKRRTTECKCVSSAIGMSIDPPHCRFLTLNCAHPKRHFSAAITVHAIKTTVQLNSQKCRFLCLGKERFRPYTGGRARCTHTHTHTTRSENGHAFRVVKRRRGARAHEATLGEARRQSARSDARRGLPEPRVKRRVETEEEIY